jgi:hypothetical protein
MKVTVMVCGRDEKQLERVRADLSNMDRSASAGQTL